ncbi:MAG: hypothetical protein BGN97_08870 [Microbacterium sp. 69-10]|uniref:hypothetical protein n=1 Tax=Microbacterium sp. 69-10 TaxID=1895783 RepID=UPI000961A0B1|nr:hypothetical protein [Microbacterium sp. 69-10]OJU42456.1 MAG: hypothetical protein BGN97_08870 [Microbacterium sp. 69-10]
MIDVDAGGTDARARRRTWTLGGALIALSALLELGLPGLQGLFTGMPFPLTRVLFWAGAVVLAIGMGRAGSVTASRPLGTGVIIALAVWQVLVVPVVAPLTTLFAAGEPADAGYSTAVMIGYALNAVALILAILAAVQIARAGVVPPPWRWAPMWVLAAAVAAALLPGLAFAIGMPVDQTSLSALFGFFALLRAGAIGALGVLAMVLAARPVAGSTSVYSSGE